MERKHPQPTAAGTGLSHRVPADFLWKAATTIALALAGVVLLGIAGLAAKVLLATFAGLLLATFLLALRDGLARHTPLSPGWALTVVILLLSAAFLVGGWLLAPQLATQIEELGQRLPQIAEQTETSLRQSGWGRQLLIMVGSEQTLQSLQEGLGSFFSATIQTFGLLITFVAVGLFIASNPDLYS
ncbi:MAG: AI-2E family transporter, partial [Desulfuromonadales bacterium]|nr:AI-2E family transporter [Desulfuromonadales bacterium]